MVSCLSYSCPFASQLAHWRTHSPAQDGTTSEIKVEVKPKSSANKDPNSDAVSKTFVLQLDSIIPTYTYSTDLFETDIDNSHPAFQHFTSEDSMQASTARMKSILDAFDEVYQRR